MKKEHVPMRVKSPTRTQLLVSAQIWARRNEIYKKFQNRGYDRGGALWI